MPPRGACVWTLGPLLGVLFGEAMESLGGAALLEEISFLRVGLGFL